MSSFNFGQQRQAGSPAISPVGSSPLQSTFNPPSAGGRFTPAPRLSQSQGTADEAISKQVAKWDSEMDTLDKKQEQLLNDQWKLLRTQIGSLMQALAEVKQEVQDLKDNTLPKEVESVINNLMGSHEEHGERHAGLMDRVQYLEDFVGESADRHAKEIAAAHGNHADHKTTMETRLEYLESLLGDTADKHSQALQASFEELHNKINKCATSEHHGTMEQRVGFLESYLGESVGTHDKHKTTMETRLEYIESLIGDNADRHAKEIEDAKGKLGDLHKSIQQCAKHDHASGIENRVNFLEKCLGESADKHDNHKVNMEGRLDFVEKLIGDNADKHWQEIEAAKGQLGDLNAAIGKTVSGDNHGKLEQRLNWLEQFIGETASESAKELAEAKRLGRTLVKHQTVETRLEFIETLIGDSADKHGKELDSHKGKFFELEEALSKCAKHDHASTLEGRVNYIEKCLGESADKHDDHKANMEERMEYVEALIGDNADKHWKEIQEHKGKMGDIHAALKKCAKEDNHGNLEKKVAYLENLLGDSFSKHKAEVAESQKKHTTVEQHQSLETRMEYLEALLGDSADKHSKELEKAQSQVKDLHGAIKACAKMEHHATTQERLDYLEKLVGDSADQHEKHRSELEAAHARIKDIHGKIASDGSNRDQKHGGVEERLLSLERKYGDHADNLNRKVSTLEAGHMKLQNGANELHSALRGDSSSRDGKHAEVDERLLAVENFIQQSFERHVAELNDAKTKLRDTSAGFERTKASLDTQRATVDQRLEALESGGGGSGGGFSEYTKDLDKRLFYMQEDQKRARDVLESSLQEQIRLEHSLHDDQARQVKEYWDRETKTRMAYQEQYKDLLQQERSGRENMEVNIDSRVRTLEQMISMETQRLWTAMDKHTHEGLKEVIVQQPPHIVETLMPQTQMLPPVVEVMQPQILAPMMSATPQIIQETIVQTPNGPVIELHSPRAPPPTTTFNVSAGTLGSPLGIQPRMISGQGAPPTTRQTFGSTSSRRL